MKIITITLNPAFDMHSACDDLKLYNENFARMTSYEAGGKGVNISRALTYNGVENMAYIVVGNENKKMFLDKLKDDNISYKEFEVLGRIRENITLHTKGEKETRISFAGLSADNRVVCEIQKELEKENLCDCIVTLTGSLPAGVDIEGVKSLLMYLKEKGTKIVLDSRSFTKKDIIDVKPWLIKPNEEEIKMYADADVTDINSASVAAKKLHKEGIENVLISLGSKGAVLCNCDGTFGAEAPNIDVISTIGAGDSTIAGFIEGMLINLKSAEILKNAVSYGSAACLREGSEAPQKSDIIDIYERIAVYQI